MDEETERKNAVRLRARVTKLEADLGAIRVEKLEWDTGIRGAAASMQQHGKAFGEWRIRMVSTYVPRHMGRSKGCLQFAHTSIGMQGRPWWIPWSS